MSRYFYFIAFAFFIVLNCQAKPNPEDLVSEEKIIEEINSIFFNETGNFTVQPTTTASPFSFGESEFYALLSTAQDYVSHQINTAEKAINELEIRARESFNVSGVILNRLIVDTDSTLQEFRAQIENESRNGKMADCLESRSHVEILGIITDARDQVRECSGLANVNVNKQLKKFYSSIQEIGIKVHQLKQIANACLREPGIGEKLNCFLAKSFKVGQILEKIITIFRATVASTAENFAGNVKKASVCMTQISHEAIRDVNELITVARECAQANSIDPRLAERVDDGKVSEVAITIKE